MLRGVAEGFRLLSAATLVSTAFLSDSQWDPDTLDVWSYVNFVLLGCCRADVALCVHYVQYHTACDQNCFSFQKELPQRNVVLIHSMKRKLGFR